MTKEAKKQKKQLAQIQEELEQMAESCLENLNGQNFQTYFKSQVKNYFNQLHIDYQLNVFIVTESYSTHSRTKPENQYYIQKRENTNELCTVIKITKPLDDMIYVFHVFLYPL